MQDAGRDILYTLVRTRRAPPCLGGARAPRLAWVGTESVRRWWQTACPNDCNLAPVSIVDDEGLMRTLAALGLTPEDLVAIGGEACVFRYGANHVARITHQQVTLTQVQKRRDLLEELAQGTALCFEIPRVEQLLVPCDRIVTIEPWLPGVTLKQALETATPRQAEALVVSALEAARELGTSNFERSSYGDLFWEPPTQDATWCGYLVRRAARSLETAGGHFATVDAKALVAPFEEPERPGFLHFDLYPGNILVAEGSVSALLDFGGMAMAGDRRLDPFQSRSTSPRR